MRKLYLTPDQQKYYDPTGKGFQHINGYKGQSFFNPSTRWCSFPGTNISDWVLNVSQQYKSHSLYNAYNREMLTKVGPQGGRFSFEDMERKVLQYYEIPSIQDVHPMLYVGRDYLLQMIRDRLEKHGPPCYVEPKYYNTCSGLKTMSKKGSWTAETHASKYWNHPFPNLPGQRRMRGKDRVIYMDDVINVRHIEETLSAVKGWLVKEFPNMFASWMEPSLMQALITKQVDRNAHVIETDYDSMDQHFTRKVVTELILPIYEILMPDTYLSFASFVEELFEQPIYMGDYLLMGEHTLLSGQGITNDFETLYTLELGLGVLVSYGVLHSSLLLANGDDALLTISKCTDRFPYYVLDTLREVSASVGMIIHSEESGKSAIRRGECIYLRKVYYPRGRRSPEGNLLGAYPTALVLNNIVQPERLSPNRAQYFIALLQRLDNAVGSPDYHELLNCVYSNTRKNLDWGMRIDQQDIDAVNEKDWWFRVYGERWDPSSSPSYLEAKKRYKFL